jgi:uncharacterized protein YutE (UPF0331/DUF86 family)
VGIDRSYVARALADLRRWIAFLRGLGPLGAEELRSNMERQLAVLHALQLAVQVLLDVGGHVIAALPAGPIEEYAQIGRLLGEHGVLAGAQAETVQRMAGFRNIVVHRYAELELDKVSSILAGGVADLEEVARSIHRFVETHPEL